MKKLMSVAFAASLISGFAHADLVKTGSVIYDSSTGLDWLSLTASTGFTYNAMEAAMNDTSSVFYGYQFAAVSDVKTLFNNQGYTGDFYNEVSDSSSRLAVSNIFELFGQTGTNCCARGDGMLLNQDGGSVGLLFYIPTVSWSGGASLVRVLDNLVLPNEFYWDSFPENKMGSWLVKAHVPAVPEPDVSLLAACGVLLAIAGLKKKSQTS